MWDRERHVRLLPSSAKLLLLQRLSGVSLPQHTQAELVSITGLSRDTVCKALTQLADDGWLDEGDEEEDANATKLDILPFTYKSEVPVPTVEGEVQGCKDEMEDGPATTQDEQDVGERQEDAEQPEPQDTQVTDVVELLEACEQADVSGVRKEKIASLQAVWGYAFPVEKYEYSQLQKGFAMYMTRDGRSTAWAGQLILYMGDKLKDRVIESLIGFMRTVFDSEEQKDAERKKKMANINTPSVDPDGFDIGLMRRIAEDWKKRK